MPRARIVGLMFLTGLLVACGGCNLFRSSSGTAPYVAVREAQVRE